MSPVKPSLALRLQQHITAYLQRLPWVTKISVLSCLTALVLWLQDVLLYFFPFLLFILMLAMLGAGLLGLGTFSWAVVYAVQGIYRQLMRRSVNFRRIGVALFPLVLHGLTLWLILTVNATQIWLDFNFAVMRPSRVAVVELVQAGKLAHSNHRSTVTLPWTYSWVSSGGTIDISGTGETAAVLFYTFSGFDSLAGFVYSPSDAEPSLEPFSRGKILGVKAYGDRWFWFSTT